MPANRRRIEAVSPRRRVQCGPPGDYEIRRCRTLLARCLGMASAATDAMLFRLFLTDGTSIVSYGEFARVEDHVIFSMVMGGRGEPRLHAATLPANVIDWDRTTRQATSTRYQWYAATRGEDDFLRLSNDVAAVINKVLVDPRPRAGARSRAAGARDPGRMAARAFWLPSARRPRDPVVPRRGDIGSARGLGDDGLRGHAGRQYSRHHPRAARGHAVAAPADRPGLPRGRS